MNSELSLSIFVVNHTDRGECKCGQCCDTGSRPDPNGHTADLVFFKVSQSRRANKATFVRLTKEHTHAFGDGCDPLDGQEHGYMELGGWLGDQAIALRYMGLGVLLGVFDLLSPRTVLPGIDDEKAMKLAAAGYVTVRKRRASLPAPPPK